MSEDCLYLNIFTPAGHAARSRQGKFLSGAKLLPVMVWLHGGAFQQGGARRSEYDGRHLAERDIVVVSLNYRLGALGFMVSSEDGLYGNFGLMDQRAALSWVNENVRAFGGDPENVTLFGESAGAVMIGLHLMMEGAGTLFHRAIMQSNPLGYTFRSVVVADFIGEALKRGVDCRDLNCLRTERVEEILRAQASLMGVPRSVGDFFTWGPTLTKEIKVKLSLNRNGGLISKSEENRLPRLDAAQSRQFVSEWRYGSDEITSDSAKWSAVNVSQPLNSLHLIPDDIPVIIGSNKHEGEIFVHSAFPAPMPKPVYWMFVGALFRDSASRVLKHYRAFVEEVEQQAEELAKKQMEEEEAKHEYLENRDNLESEYELLLAMNATKRRERFDQYTGEGLRALVNTWSTGFDDFGGGGSRSRSRSERGIDPRKGTINNPVEHSDVARDRILKKVKKEEAIVDDETFKTMSLSERRAFRAKQRKERRIARQKAKALKEAAKVVVDYRPVMSKIIDDYLFRCPSWHLAQLLTERREKTAEGHENNVFVYRFSQPTHIPGYRECWGKSCHTAELPFVFEAMDVIRSNYSTIGPIAQDEAPSAPDYPYTEIMNAFKGAFEASDSNMVDIDANMPTKTNTNTDAKKQLNQHHFGYRNYTHMNNKFQSILTHFFGDYFTEDADEELASDMAERWTSFAREGTPNYDGSKAEWFPWRYRQSEASTAAGHHPDYDSLHPENYETDEFTDYSDSEDEFYYSDYNHDDVSDEYLDIDEFDDSPEGNMQFYRTRALDALQVQVIEQDVHRTELRRSHPRKGGTKGNNDAETSILPVGTLLKKRLKLGKDEKPPVFRDRKTVREVLRAAQEIGVMGAGLQGDISKGYFPELLELRLGRRSDDLLKTIALATCGIRFVVGALLCRLNNFIPFILYLI